MLILIRDVILRAEFTVRAGRNNHWALFTTSLISQLVSPRIEKITYYDRLGIFSIRLSQHVK